MRQQQYHRYHRPFYFEFETFDSVDTVFKTAFLSVCYKCCMFWQVPPTHSETSCEQRVMKMGMCPITSRWRHVSVTASQFNCNATVFSTEWSGQQNYKLCVTGLFMREIHRWSLDSPYKGPVMQKKIPRHDFIVRFVWYLTHLPMDKMAVISYTIFSDAFSWMKIFVFWLKFHLSLFLGVRLTIIQHWFIKWLGAKPLSEPMLTRFTDAFMRHEGEMS